MSDSCSVCRCVDRDHRACCHRGRQKCLTRCGNGREDVRVGEVMVGREAESVALDAALAGAASSTRGVLVTGPAGIGKSTIVQAFLVRAREVGAITVSTSAVPTAESELPYAPVAQMLRRLHRDHSARLAAAVGPQAAAVISPLVPDLFGAFGPAPPVTAASPGLERSRLLSALSGVVESLTSDSSLVIVVEDLHWVDTSTLALLGVLLRGTPQTGLLVVATAREPAPSEQVRRWCAVERASARLSVLTVPPFTASETSQLLAAEGQDPSETGRAAEVHRLSGGNPSLVRELARVGHGAMPDSVMELVGSAMAALPVAAQQVTQAVAVAGRPLEHTDLARLVGEPAARQGAGAALGSGLVVVSSDRYTCVHDLARSAVRDATLPADRRRLHLAMARMLADRGASTANAVDLAETAWHFEQAGSPPDTFSWAFARCGRSAAGR